MGNFIWAKIGNFPTLLKESNTLQSTSLLKPLEEFTIKLISTICSAVVHHVFYLFSALRVSKGNFTQFAGGGGIYEPLAHLDLCVF